MLAVAGLPVERIGARPVATAGLDRSAHTVRLRADCQSQRHASVRYHASPAVGLGDVPDRRPAGRLRPAVPALSRVSFWMSFRYPLPVGCGV